MKIVIDTNVVISAVFFGGIPLKVIQAVAGHRVSACANSEIVQEYNDIFSAMIFRKHKWPRYNVFPYFLDQLEIVPQNADVQFCRDPDDDKFLSCAVDAKALYIVSGDKDLLDIESYERIEIITAAEFCARYGL